MRNYSDKGLHNFPKARNPGQQSTAQTLLVHVLVTLHRVLVLAPIITCLPLTSIDSIDLTNNGFVGSLLNILHYVLILLAILFKIFIPPYQLPAVHPHTENLNPEQNSSYYQIH